MLKWANRIVRYSSDAEDIVQNAVLQTFRHLDRLQDSAKFVPWLRKIVHNQALMSLRKKGREVYLDTEALESVGHYAVSYTTAGIIDPEEVAAQRLALAEVERMLSRLSPRERDVLKAHTMAGLSIPDVANRLNMKSGAVYTTLSRARVKLAEGRFEDEIEQYVAARRRKNTAHQSFRTVPRTYRWMTGAHNTMVSMMLETLILSGVRQYTLSDIMGRTGHAFRLQLTEDIGIASAYAYDWAKMMKSGWRNLGYSVNIFGGAGVRLQDPNQMIDATDRIHASLEQGIPAVTWNVASFEFGLIWGCNDESSSWITTDTTVSGKRLSYSKLGRQSTTSEWFIAMPNERIRSTFAQSFYQIFTQAVVHVRGEEAAFLPSCFQGLDGYKAWIHAFCHRLITNPLANAYNIALTREARTHAAQFLQQLLSSEELKAVCPEAIPAVGQAFAKYESIAGYWEIMARLFPLPHGGDPYAPGPADRAVCLLERAMQAEREAADTLEAAAYWLSQRM